MPLNVSVNEIDWISLIEFVIDNYDIMNLFMHALVLKMFAVLKST